MCSSRTWSSRLECRVDWYDRRARRTPAAVNRAPPAETHAGTEPRSTSSWVLVRVSMATSPSAAAMNAAQSILRGRAQQKSLIVHPIATVPSARPASGVATQNSWRARSTVHAVRWRENVPKMMVSAPHTRHVRRLRGGDRQALFSPNHPKEVSHLPRRERPRAWLMLACSKGRCRDRPVPGGSPVVRDRQGGGCGQHDWSQLYRSEEEREP